MNASGTKLLKLPKLIQIIVENITDKKKVVILLYAFVVNKW